MSRVVRGVATPRAEPAPAPPSSPPDAGERIKHLEFIQSIIARLAANSFFIKGWTVTLATGLIGVSADRNEAAYAAVAIVPAVIFWCLDAYYLRQERLYRKLYDDARHPAEQQTQPVEVFGLSVLPYRDAVPSWIATMLAISLLPLHGVVLLAALVAAVYVGI